MIARLLLAALVLTALALSSGCAEQIAPAPAPVESPTPQSPVPHELQSCPKPGHAPALPAGPRTFDQLATWIAANQASAKQTERALVVCRHRLGKLNDQINQESPELP